MALTIGDNFDYKGQKPNFARDSFDTLADMKAFAETSIDDGHISFCKEDSKHYVYNSANDDDNTTGKWREAKLTDTTYNVAQESADGLMPSNMYSILDLIGTVATDVYNVMAGHTYISEDDLSAGESLTEGIGYNKVILPRMLPGYIDWYTISGFRGQEYSTVVGTMYLSPKYTPIGIVNATTGRFVVGTIIHNGGYENTPLIHPLIPIFNDSVYGENAPTPPGDNNSPTLDYGLLSATMFKKLYNIEEEADKTTVTPALTTGTQIATINGTAIYAPVAGESVTYEQATSDTLGLVKLGSDTVQSTAASAVTSTSSRTYAVQLDSEGKMVVNVPWTNTNTTYSTATSTTTGLVALGSDTVQTVAANSVTSTASRTYAVQLNGSNQMVVNVPWTDNNTTYSAATSSTLGLVRLGSDTEQTVSANTVTTTASRTYAVQVNSDNQLVVNVPWSNTTYSVATTSANGLMSSTDKTKLDGIEDGADVTSVSATLTSGTLVATINGTSIYAPTAEEAVTYDVATSTTLGLVSLGSDTVQTVAANSVTSTASRTYAVQKNSSNQLVVNVPWTDTNTNTTYSAATSTTLGLVKLASDTVQTVAAATPTTTASRTYAVQMNSDDQLVVNVPWANTTYSAATTSANGLMSSTDKSRLDAIWEWYNDIQTNTEGVIVTLDE